MSYDPLRLSLCFLDLSSHRNWKAQALYVSSCWQATSHITSSMQFVPSAGLHKSNQAQCNTALFSATTLCMMHPSRTDFFFKTSQFHSSLSYSPRPSTDLARACSLTHPLPSLVHSPTLCSMSGPHLPYRGAFTRHRCECTSAVVAKKVPTCHGKSEANLGRDTHRAVARRAAHHQQKKGK